VKWITTAVGSWRHDVCRNCRRNTRNTHRTGGPHVKSRRRPARSTVVYKRQRMVSARDGRGVGAQCNQNQRHWQNNRKHQNGEGAVARTRRIRTRTRVSRRTKQKNRSPWTYQAWIALGTRRCPCDKTWVGGVNYRIFSNVPENCYRRYSNKFRNLFRRYFISLLPEHCDLLRVVRLRATCRHISRYSL